MHNEIKETYLHYNEVDIDKFIVMPNHIHMIITVNKVGGENTSLENGTPRASRPTAALIPTIVSTLKKKTNKAIGFSIWQTSYHDHIIRNEADYRRIWQYIDENPLKWQEDKYYTS